MKFKKEELDVIMFELKEGKRAYEGLARRNPQNEKFYLAQIRKLQVIEEKIAKMYWKLD